MPRRDSAPCFGVGTGIRRFAISARVGCLSPPLEPLGSTTAFAVGGPEAVVLAERRFSGKPAVSRQPVPSLTACSGRTKSGHRTGPADVAATAEGKRRGT